MHKFKVQILVFFVVLSSSVTLAQPWKTIKPFKPYKWMIGVSWTAIDDDGHKFDRLFDFANSWNILPYPTKISLDRYFVYGWSAEAAVAYQKYLPGKIIQDTNNVTSDFFCFDINGKYSFYQKYAPRARWIEPYFTFGVGYTYRTSALVAQHVPTLNLGFGFNIWIIKNLGIQFHSNGKLGLYPGFWDSHTSYLQHSAGLVYRIQSNSTQRSDFGRRKNKWVHSNKGYKQKGGH